MSAEIEPTHFQAACSECAEGHGPGLTEEEAQSWADQHNTEYHTPETETP